MNSKCQPVCIPDFAGEGGYNDFDDGPGWGGSGGYNDGPGWLSGRGGRGGPGGPSGLKVGAFERFRGLVHDKVTCLLKLCSQVIFVK